MQQLSTGQDERREGSLARLRVTLGLVVTCMHYPTGPTTRGNDRASDLRTTKKTWQTINQYIFPLYGYLFFESL